MHRLHRWLFVSQATRKAALLCFSAVLRDGLRPGRRFSRPRRWVRLRHRRAVIFSATTRSSSRSHVGQTAYIGLDVRLSKGQTQFVRPVISLDFFTSGAGPFFYNGVLQCGRRRMRTRHSRSTRVHDPCKNVNWTFTVSLHVLP